MYILTCELCLLYIAPFYRYWNGRDHFYTTNINEIGTATPGQAGNHGYTSEGTQCVIRRGQVSGSIPLYRYWNGNDHFYTTNANEIGVTTPGAKGNHGYTSEGTAGYCFPSQVQNTIPLYRYYRPSGGDHFYTTNANEIGTTTRGQTGNHGYRSEGIQCYVHPRNCL